MLWVPYLVSVTDTTSLGGRVVIHGFPGIPHSLPSRRVSLGQGPIQEEEDVEVRAEDR